MIASASPAGAPCPLRATLAKASQTLSLRGDCVALTIERLPEEFTRFVKQAAGSARFDVSGLSRLDSAGAQLLANTLRLLERRGVKAVLDGLADDHRALFERVSKLPEQATERPSLAQRGLTALNAQGRRVVEGLGELRDLAGFWGMMLARLASCILNPRRIRATPVVAQIDQTGVRAIPIVALLTFLIGLVVAYMAAGQLARFGANIFIVDLVVIACMRELGVLIMAIIVAGRSGSAFTAQIGSMQANEEVAAMRTMGMNPLDVLVLPRVLALVIAMPLLTIVADVASIFGGMIAAWFSLDISFQAFIGRMYTMLNLNHFWVGLVKAPFFALLISCIGCFQGFRVTGSAESVGQLTTRSVVHAIFLVILADAGFALLFMSLRI